MIFKRTGALLLGSAAALALGACGGGSSGVAPPPQTSLPPPPAATPSPAPAPAAPNLDSAEYRRSNAATSMDALTAYQAGAFGEGVTVAVIDTGIDTDSAQFAGRISGASGVIGAPGSLKDTDGHGTSVAAVIAAAADNDPNGMQGIAPRATIQALKASDEASCGDDDGCGFPDRQIAESVDAARIAGAKVTNISLGGSAAQRVLKNAIDRATQAGMVVVISAGNDSNPRPDPMALVALDPAANGRVIIAGAIDQQDQPADFTNAAGDAGNFYLSALGVRVRSFNENGDPFLYSGTSYAAPGVAGALALLFSAFPNLTADEAIDILRSSARDLGDPGVDSVFGGGAVDIGAAFAPQGPTRIAGSPMILAEGTDPIATVGGAAGDGGKLVDSIGDVVVLDRYGRAYMMDMGGHVAARIAPGKLVGPLLADRRFGSAGIGPAAMSLSLSGGNGSGYASSLEARGLDARGGNGGVPLSGFVAGNLAKDMTTVLGFGYSPAALLGIGIPGEGAGMSWLSGDQRLGGDGIVSRDAAAVAQRFGALTIGFAAGRAYSLAAETLGEEDAATRLAVQASRSIGPVTVTAGFEQLQEAGTFLGSRGSDLLGIGGAHSDFITFSAYAQLGGQWSLGLDLKRGETVLELNGGLATAAERVASGAMAIDVSRANAFRPGDRVGLRIGQPLRIEGGAITLALPTGYDYAARSAIMSQRQVELTPSGRELALEGAYQMPLPAGYLQANAFFRNQPGHLRHAPTDAGVALRLGTRF